MVVEFLPPMPGTMTKRINTNFKKWSLLDAEVVDD
jgi:hypothetical protein